MRSFSVVWVQLLLGLLLKPASQMAVGVSVTVTPDQDSIITIAKDTDGEGCDACVDEGGNLTCNVTEFVLSKPVETTIQFNCTKPQDVYKVKTEGRVDCTSDSCSPEAGKVQAALFTEFHRSFLWTISGPDGTLLGLDFSGTGLKDVPESEACEDGYLYSVSKTDAEGAVQTQNYCRNGTVTHLDLPSKASVSVVVPPQGEVLPTVFSLAPKPKPVKKGRTMEVTPDPDTRVTISRDAASAAAECSVCLGAGPNPDCNTQLILREPLSTTIQFTCEKPEDIFKVEINRDFDYTGDPSSSKEMLADSSLFPEFQRSFTWDMKVDPSRTFQLDFPSPGMKQIAPTESCPDEHTYSIITYQRFGLATIGTFCKNGTISQIQVLYKGRVSLSVPKNKKLDTPAIKVSVGPDTKMLAIVQPQLPRGQSYSDFFSANYVSGFPSNEMMGWEFVVPPKHNFTVSFLGHTAPICGTKAVEVRYEQEGKAPVVKSMTEEQPTNLQGSFSLLLQNCDSVKKAGSPKLTLNFRVSVLRSGVPHLCAVNMQKEAGITLNIENTNPVSYCEMEVDGTAQEKITVPPGAKSTLSFLDCPSKDLLLTVTKTIECQSLAACAVSRTPLTIPTLETCLPVPIHNAIWHLRVPEHGTVALQSPAGNLRQSLPGDECGGEFSLHVAESDGSPVGQFCSGGVIRKVQIHNNVTITATAASAMKLRSGLAMPLFNVSFGPEIKESIVFHVNPKAMVQVPVLLGTPGWPRGMKPLSTVSWIIQLPSQHRADLLFTNISQPKCQKNHATIKVQTIGSEEELLSRREDEKLDNKLGVTASFYLNMSNCLPESGSFSALSKVMVEKKSKKLLGIILGVVGALLVLTAIVLAVVCVVTRKKKLAHRVSIYNPKGNLFHPGETSFKPDNGSHVYDSIDETMTYSHLIGDSGYNGAETGSYRPFTSPVDVKPPIIEVPENNKKEEFSTFLDPAESFGPPRPRTPLGPMKSLGFEDRRLVDNELCTFKNSGDPNPIRLSDPDPLPPPLLDDDWDNDYDNDEDYI